MSPRIEPSSSSDIKRGPEDDKRFHLPSRTCNRCSLAKTASASSSPAARGASTNGDTGLSEVRCPYAPPWGGLCSTGLGSMSSLAISSATMVESRATGACSPGQGEPAIPNDAPLFTSDELDDLDPKRSFVEASFRFLNSCTLCTSDDLSPGKTSRFLLAPRRTVRPNGDRFRSRSALITAAFTSFKATSRCFASLNSTKYSLRPKTGWTVCIRIHGWFGDKSNDTHSLVLM
mmetsp:Transcript_3871/g.10709  ORF Transcript_3871/g.10709 Transcript_3871/m.10709 type:complete len:232 (-) Transcript_3871:2068-2763(-)